MANYTRKVKRILTDNGCHFVRHGKGDHEIWHSSITNRIVVVDGKIVKRSSANETIKEAGIKTKL
ncbi:MAG: type II toxin-antitoxin system HicA family toxin [Defluviitaleaceae bacterium]|nr:type II toxin-antitoxin system HicA family toxin [Defluviitaleaceae bacterium]